MEEEYLLSFTHGLSGSSTNIKKKQNFSMENWATSTKYFSMYTEDFSTFVAIDLLYGGSPWDNVLHQN